MQVVINISPIAYQAILSANNVSGNWGDDLLGVLCRGVANGTLLPKGHGKLVDISKIDEDRIESDNPIIYLTINGEYTEAVSLDYLNSLPTIIEADEKE